MASPLLAQSVATSSGPGSTWWGLRWARAFGSLWWMSVRRLWWSTNTLMVLLPLLGVALFLLRRPFRGDGDAETAFRSFSNFLMVVDVSFLIPICAIAYGAASIGGDREDRTLVFLLVRPIPRPLILLAKFAASLPLTLALAGGSFWLFCRLTEETGSLAWSLYWPTILLVATAYVALFHLFAVWFRHATIISLIYALFMEVLIGNMPGIVKRVAISYYGKTLMYSAGQEHGLNLPDERFFEMIAPASAAQALVGFSVGFLLAAVLMFQLREYRDLT